MHYSLRSLALLVWAAAAPSAAALGCPPGDPIGHAALDPPSACASSARDKRAIEPLTASGLALKLRPVGFVWRQTGMADIGFLAEEVAEIDPRLVVHDENGRVQGVREGRITALLVLELQRLERERARLAGELEALRRRQDGELLALEARRDTPGLDEHTSRPDPHPLEAADDCTRAGLCRPWAPAAALNALPAECRDRNAPDATGWSDPALAEGLNPRSGLARGGH